MIFLGVIFMIFSAIVARIAHYNHETEWTIFFSALSFCLLLLCIADLLV
jgi:hypothetical protein